MFKERSAQVINTSNQYLTSSNIKISHIKEYGDTIKLNINTIKPYTGHGGGQYVVTSVKQMSSTPDFDNFPENVKKCQDKENIEECSNRKLLIGAANQCGCLPHIINQFQTALKV